MTTSLAAQLQRLAAPQTSLLYDSRKKPSILFKAGEAASKDREVIYDIGINGLQELIQLNPSFAQFEDTLFDKTSIDLQRAVENKELNRKLDDNIRKFFFHLSPYVMLQPAHKCLEWLIRRFHIHEFNRDDFVNLMLPYHETMIFVRCVQTLTLTGKNDPFEWLKGVKKSGAPLSKNAIINHAIGTPGFLRIYGEFLTRAVDELDNKANILQAMIAFFCTTTIGVLDGLESVGENFVVSVLRTLVKGLSSKAIDFTAASFMVIGHLVTKTNLTRKTLETFLIRVCAVMHHSLTGNATMLMVLILQTQQGQLGELSEEVIGALLATKWLPRAVATVKSEGVNVIALIRAVLVKCLQKICQQDANLEMCRKFCEELMLEVTLDEEECEDIIRCVLDSYFCKSGQPIATAASNTSNDDKSSEIISLDSEDEDFECKDEAVTRWYSDFLKRLENQYPNAFDNVVKQVMKGQGNFSQNKRNALRNVLGFLMQASYSEDDANIFENLFHYDVDRRMDAVRYLVNNFQNISLKGDGNRDLLKDSIKERLEDDKCDVVAEVLKLRAADLVQLIGKDQLIEKLITISLKCLRRMDTWQEVTPKVIDLLTDKYVVEGTNLNKIIIALYPFLFPSEDDELGTQISKQVMATSFAREYNILMLSVNPTKKIDCESILGTLEEMLGVGQTFHAIQICFYVTLVTSSLPLEASVDLATRVFRFTTRLLSGKHKYVPSSSLSCLKQNRLPMDIHVILSGYLIDRVRFDTRNSDFSEQSESFSLQLNIFKLLVEKYFSIKDEYKAIKKVYGKELSKFLNLLYPEPEKRIEFLTSFYTVHLLERDAKDVTSNSKTYVEPELQIRTFKLLNAMLAQVGYQLSINILLNTLLGLKSDSAVIRECAISSLELIASGNAHPLDPTFKSFLKMLLKRREELAMDGEQLPLVMFTIFSSDNSRALNKILQALLGKVLDSSTPEYVVGGLLDMLKLIDDDDIFSKTVIRGIRIMKKADRAGKNYLFGMYESRVLRSLVARINPNTTKTLTRNDQCRDFVNIGLSNHLPLPSAEGKHTSVSILLIDALGEEVFVTFSQAYAKEILRQVVEAATVAQNPETSAAAGKFFKSLKLDVKLVLDLLDKMIVQKENKKEKRKSSGTPTTTNSVFSSSEWTCGVTLLEMLQNKKQLLNTKLLIPKLFEVLKFCLDLEEQSGVEYVKQMILSLLLHCCSKMEDGSGNRNDNLPKSAFKVELIVQCIRGTQNPQTHHHALLLLAHVTDLVPDQVLQNIMEIFTFMGSSVVRHDDVYSIQIITKIIETIIPTLAREENSANKQNKVIPILKIFTDVILDVPEHRRVPLYTKLIQTLGPSDYLWMFLGVLLESDVMKGGKKAEVESEEKVGKKKKKHNIESEHSPNFSKRLEIAMNIAQEFDPSVIVETCTQLVRYIQGLPLQIDTNKDHMEIDVTDSAIFSIEYHTNKQLRHYRYSTSLFVATLIKSTHVINKIALLNEEDTAAMKVCYRDLIVGSLAYVNVVAKVVDKARSENNEREKSYWEISLVRCYEILEGIIALLAPDMTITVFGGLMKHRTLLIRLKVIDIFNKKLQYNKDYFDESHHSRLLELLNPLMQIVKGIFVEEDVVGSTSARFKIAQEAYLTVKHLSKILAQKNPAQFKHVLAGFIDGLHDYKKNPNPHLLASLILCIGELSVNLGPHSIPYLPKYIPMLTKFIARQVKSAETFDMLTSSIVTSILKVIDTLARFLSPYLKSIIIGISKLHAKLPDNHDQRLSIISSRLTQIWEKLASLIPLRLLVPAIEESYTEIVKEGELGAIGPLMKLLSNSFNSIQTSEFTGLQSELSEFFLSALQFRCDNASSAKFLAKSIDIAEEHVIKAFVVLILKLSESTFRPLYYKVFEWANRDSSSNDRAITFFNLSSHVADALKHLFVLFASELITNAAKLLDATNAGKSDDLFFPDSSKNVTLIRYILRTLLSVLVNDNQNFINSVRFDTLLQPIANQLENVIIFEDNEIRKLVIDCLSQMAVAVADDTLWRQLNHQVLLKTRNNDPEIRLFALDACTEIARKIGENFAPLLPESIPFLAELQEDENQAVENAVQKTIREIEKVTGEPLHKYL
ncbi:HEAT repeat-containing protein 1 homolog [Topomyia yanbarensis]|uniref:HEAT repeat-containing protein 1 homolog n=1 Tax=Topomyia yanbarensis TaxID=2498891 RepID=UPI00273C766B|nr:HEAT repeat-containing protein 1 homolog [Topomyia yanbarensis]XP_058814546.1 HEAT repeat-containing protein 1 homolog [Topomyia yanbarensis]